jgi:hypothetical protein
MKDEATKEWRTLKDGQILGRSVIILDRFF